MEKELSSASRERARARRKRRREKLKASLPDAPKNLSEDDTGRSVGGVSYNDLSSDQKEAYKGTVEWWTTQQEIGGVPEPFVLSGVAGGGKTTLLGLVFPTLVRADGGLPRIKYATYTGKAADVMKTKGMDGDTLHHTFFNWYPQKDGTLLSEIKDFEELNADLIVIDEASMVPKDLREEIESIGCPIIYCGDAEQLGPVAKSDTDNVMLHPHFRLEQVHRQALDSGILKLATDARLKKPIKRGEYGVNKDAKVVTSDHKYDIELLGSADIVLCYTNKTRHKYNSILREAKGYKGKYPEVGEKLICTKNNRDQGLFNGLILYVKACREEAGFLWMDLVDESGQEYNNTRVYMDYFEGKEHPKVFGKPVANFLEYGYVISTHKAQGSEWPFVIVMEEPMPRLSMKEKRRWKYTAITRASKKLLWILKGK